MSHSAGGEFFKSKKLWSKRKDHILATYLRQYLPKIILNLKRPVCVVDAFAGPGVFADGAVGSPRIICDEIAKIRQNPDAFGWTISTLLIERDPLLFESLRKNMHGTPNTRLVCDDFRNQIPEIARVARDESLFLYLDPFTVEAIEWEPLDTVFSLLADRQSIEVLLNFNVAIFARMGLMALKIITGSSGEVMTDEDFETPLTNPTADTLDRVAGGSWWREVLKESPSFAEACRQITDRYAKQLRTRFRRVCWHEVKERAHHQCPKYVLFFGSRSGVALELMNDAMCESREQFANEERPTGHLFEMLPESLAPDISKLPAAITSALSQQMTREQLVREVVESQFGLFKCKTIRNEIGEMVKRRTIVSLTGSGRLNNESLLEKAAKRG